MLDKLNSFHAAGWVQSPDHLNDKVDHENVPTAREHRADKQPNPGVKLLQDAQVDLERLNHAQKSTFQQVITGEMPGEGVLADKALAMHQLDRSLNGLDVTKIALPPDLKKFSAGPEAKLFSVAPRSEVATESLSIEGSGDFKLWGDISKAVNSINKGYLEKYQEIVAKYTAYYKDFSDKVLAKLGDWVKAAADSGDDKDKIQLTVSKLTEAIKGINDKEVVVYTGVASADGETDANADAKSWFKDLTGKDGADGDAAGGFILKGNQILINNKPGGDGVEGAGPLSVMLDSLKNMHDGDKLNSAKFQAWKSGFDAEAEQLKNTLQTLTQKYSNANSIFDNLVKVLSSTITACMETAKSFLQI